MALRPSASWAVGGAAAVATSAATWLLNAAAGAFNPYAIAGLVGGGSAADQTAQNTAAALALLRRILDAVVAGAVFGA